MAVAQVVGVRAPGFGGELVGSWLRSKELGELLELVNRKCHSYWAPRHSMYAIYAYIDPPNHPNVGKYGIHGVSGHVNHMS